MTPFLYISENLEIYDMKYQFVKRILGISLAVCTAYGSVRGAYAAVAGAYAAAAESQAAVAVTDTYSEQENANTAEDYTYSASSAPDMNIAAEQREEEEAIIPESEPGAEEEILPEPEPEIEEEILPEPEPEAEEEILPEPEPEEPEITLEEYLSGLRCGACGRCCSLLNPHCRNGKHKAQAAEQQYYEMM